MDDATPSAWNEDTSLDFLKYGDYFVPQRELQIETLTALVSAAPRQATVLELCCGAGLLSEAILSAFPGCSVYGLDGSTVMLKHAAVRLQGYGGRFHPRPFDLAKTDWRADFSGVDAVVSSLAIHHLDGAQKQRLFADCYRMLAPGGALAIADLIQPAAPIGREIAARAWDRSVRQRALARDGNDAMFEQFDRMQWNYFRFPDEMDMPSGVYTQLQWLAAAGFVAVDVYWLHAGHAVYGGFKPPAFSQSPLEE